MINGRRKITCRVRDITIPSFAIPIEVKKPEDTGWITVCKGHKHKYFQITFCKLKIQITSCSEDTHDLVWKYLETEKKISLQLHVQAVTE